MSLASVNMERPGVASGGMFLALSRVSVECTVVFSTSW